MSLLGKSHGHWEVAASCRAHSIHWQEGRSIEQAGAVIGVEMLQLLLVRCWVSHWKIDGAKYVIFEANL